MQNNILERDLVHVSAGRWASIEKKTYRNTNLEHAVYVPLAQSGALGAACGITGGIVAALLGAPWQVSLGLGSVVGLGMFTITLFDAVTWARTALESIEQWESEAAQGGQAESSTVRVELIEHNQGGGGRVIYDQLSLDPHTLQAIAKPDTQLSKRGLMALGISDTDAMRIVAQLLAFGYATRKADNMHAYWTSKGQALCRALGGGGGGGGGGDGKNQQTTTILNGVGEVEG